MRILISTALGTLMAASSVVSVDAAEKSKVFLSMSYIGNDWQAEAANTARAMALSKELKDKLELEVQVAGPNAQKQIQQVNAMVQAGAKAIVIYPISPTALNNVVKNACAKGVHIFTYDAEITETCAHNVHIDQKLAGIKAAQWLADKIGGKGNVVYLSGVPGTSTDTLRTEGSLEVFAKYPEIKIVAQVPGMWSQAVARTEMSKVLATRDWKDIDGVLGQAGCFTVFSMQDEAGIPDAEKKPCAGEGSNGHRIQMLPHRRCGRWRERQLPPNGGPEFLLRLASRLGGLRAETCGAGTGRSASPARRDRPAAGDHERERQAVHRKAPFQEMKAGCNVIPALDHFTNPGWFARDLQRRDPGDRAERCPDRSARTLILADGLFIMNSQTRTGDSLLGGSQGIWSLRLLSTVRAFPSPRGGSTRSSAKTAPARARPSRSSAGWCGPRAGSVEVFRLAECRSRVLSARTGWACRRLFRS
jgi:ribose transport system substrate-binding protein